MSHTRYEPRVTRVQRSELAVPGSNPGMFEKAAGSNADYVFLDLEDAVAPDDKEQARRNVIEALNDIDWRGRGKTVSVRINGIDTHYMYRDVVDVVEQAGHRLDTILIPKVGVSADVYMVDAMVSQIEQAKKIEHSIGLEALIETALGMANVERIATASVRMEALHFGVADYAAPVAGRGPSTSAGSTPTIPATSGMKRCPGCWSPAAHTGCAPSTVRSATSTTRMDTVWPRAVGPRSVTRGSGPSIPRKSTWPTRSSRHPRRRWRGRSGSSKHWRRRRGRERARRSSTDG